MHPAGLLPPGMLRMPGSSPKTRIAPNPCLIFHFLFSLIAKTCACYVESPASRVTCRSLVIVLSSEMSWSPSPDHLSLSAGSWKSETSPIKTVKFIVQCPKVEEPIATSSPKQRETRWDMSPRRSRKQVASSEGRRDTSSHRSNKRNAPSEARRDLSCHENQGSAKGKKRECQFCHRFPGHMLRRHVMQNHLPAIADPSKVCWSCHGSFLQTSQIQSHIQNQCPGGHYLNNIMKWVPLVMTMFRLIGRDLGLQPSQLVHYKGQHQEFCPEEFTPSPEDVNLMQAFDRNCGHNVQASYRFVPPNALICLIHWRIRGHLLGRVSQAVRREIFDLTSPSAISTVTPPARVPTATVSVPPSTPQAVPMAPPSQPVMGSFAPPVVPRAPQPNQQSVCSAVPLALQSHQPQPVQQDVCSVVPMAPQPVQQQPSIRPVVPMAPQSQASQQAVPPALPPTSMPTQPRKCLTGMDAHFHLDHFMQKMRQFRDRHLSQQLLRAPPGVSFQVTRCVPSYCFPELWQNADFLSAVPPEAQQFTVGWHPTRVADFFNPQTGFQNWKMFADLFNSENCIALGEVGLDYEQEQNPERRQQQAIMLEALVQKAIAKGKPFVLHIRDPVGENEANLHCRNLLAEIDLSESHPIYLHCFSYTWWELGLWFSRFSKCVISLAPKVISNPNPGLCEVIKDMDPRRYVLETDAPYFRTTGYHHYGAPGQIYQVAEYIASVKGPGFSVEQILGDATRNTARFYAK